MDTVTEPVPISLIAGRYLLFDINVVTYLRRTYHICGVFVGGIPQAPQQNVFLGLPIALLPEEAKILVEKGAAYIYDDTAFHEHGLQEADRKRYLESLRSQGTNAKMAAENASLEKKKKGLMRQAVLKASREASKDSTESSEPQVPSFDTLSIDNDSKEPSLFSVDRSSSRASSHLAPTSEGYAITPSITHIPSSLPPKPSSDSHLSVPPSYPLFAHLHSRGYFIMPGLRFGCDYNVYPGDPLRFHSHFLAVGYDWNQGIAMLDLVGGGRLGTAVKKGFLIGGEVVDSKSEGEVRTFAIEWAGM